MMAGLRALQRSSRCEEMPALSGPVIGMTSEDGGRAVELLGEHDPRKAMRQGHAAERKDEMGILHQRGIQSVRPSDQKSRIAHALFLPAAQRLGEVFAVGGAAALIE